MSRDPAAEMRDFSQDEPTHRGMAQFWASEVEAMQRRIAELEKDNHRMEVVLNTVHGQDQEISRLRDEKIALEAQVESDHAVIEAARKVESSWGTKMLFPEGSIELVEAVRKRDEKVNGHE